MPNTQFLGSRLAEPMIFTHHDLKEFSFKINNENFPKQPYQITISDTESQYARLFNSLYSSLGISHENTCTLVDRENFLEKYFYILSDISPSSNALSSLNEPLEMVNIGFNATFSKPLTTALTAILYILLPRKISISAARDVNIVY
jgi:hypothetical protein